jgi:predicted PurR-regulated permease PerM
MFRRRRAVPPSAQSSVAGPRTAPAHHHDSTPIDGVETPYVLRFSAAWSWRLLLVVAAVYVFLHVFSLLSVVLVPVIIGLLMSAALSPIADRLVQWRLPRSLATLVVVVGAIALIAALVALVAQQFTSGFGDLRSSFDDSLDKLEHYLANLGLSQRQLSDFFDKVQEGVQSGQGNLGGTVVKTATTAGHLIAGLFITLFATIFFTYDGRGIWGWLVSLFPEPARERVHGSGERAWAVLTSYVRATFVIAATDALGISLVALVLGLPLVVPLGVLVFLGAFIPVVGAAISGIVAVAVALVSVGPVTALIMLAGVIAVQQIEGHVLQPFLMGRLVRVHPLAIVVVIAIGAEVAGIFGALIAVPLTAVVNTVSSHLAGARRDRLDQEAGALADPAASS